MGIKKATGVDTLQFAKKDDLANLKLEVDRLDTDELAELDADKLKPVFNYLSKLSNVVQNDVVKRDVYYNAKIKDIEDKMPDITNWANNTAFNAKINYVKNKVRSISNLATNASLNAKINEVKTEITNVTNLATTTALTAVENKTPSVSDLFKKAEIKLFD